MAGLRYWSEVRGAMMSGEDCKNRGWDVENRGGCQNGDASLKR